MATKINMNEKEIATFMRTRHNSWGESLMKRTTVIRRIGHFPKNSNQAQRTYILYNTYGNILDVIISMATSPSSLRAVLPNRITVIDDDVFMTRKDYKHYLSFKIDW